MSQSTMNQNIINLLEQRPFITDSGLETTLVFHDGLDLPHFAAFTLLETDAGKQRLQDYYRIHFDIAKEKNTGFLFETPTWRANPDWAEKLGLNPSQLAELNKLAVSELDQLRKQNPTVPALISGCIGPRGDGYQPDFLMSEAEAEEYHRFQAECFATANVDLVSAITMTYPEEAIGITRAAKKLNLPVVISFTVETDGRLINGMSLKEAIEVVDRATENGPLYYMINCAHPSHFEGVLNSEGWLNRIRGIRANSSRKSHEELDNSTELDEGNPLELGGEYRELQGKLKNLAVYGGCCGTDHKHIKAITNACF